MTTTNKHDQGAQKRVSLLEKTDLTIDEVKQCANIGWRLYQGGLYGDAAKYLRRAANENHPLAQEVLVDICFRGLDGKSYSYYESAMWYLLAAQGGDPDAASYLEAECPGVLQLNDAEQQINLIVKMWISNSPPKYLTRHRLSTTGMIRYA